MDFSAYLGEAVERLLGEKPFSKWLFTRTVENDLDEPVVTYSSEQNGLEIACNDASEVNTIFVTPKGYFAAATDWLPTPFFRSRRNVVHEFGRPSKSGASWDRYDYPEYSVHYQFLSRTGTIAMITFMKAEVVPGSLIRRDSDSR